jgi:hypothetical protein
MAREIRSFQVTIPAGTPVSAPFTAAISFPPRTVMQVDWQVPTGPSGLMGWALTIGGQPVIPRNPGAYIIADGRAQSWPVEGYPDQGQWQVTGYNTDIYDHSVYLQFLLDLNAAASGQPAQIANADLSSPLPADQLGLPALPDLTLASG